MWKNWVKVEVGLELWAEWGMRGRLFQGMVAKCRSPRRKEWMVQYREPWRESGDLIQRRPFPGGEPCVLWCCGPYDLRVFIPKIIQLDLMFLKIISNCAKQCICGLDEALPNCTSWNNGFISCAVKNEFHHQIIWRKFWILRLLIPIPVFPFYLESASTGPWSWGWFLL